MTGAGYYLTIAAMMAMSYLLGSINFAIIVSRLLAKEDVRSHGSGNAGMTNMLRTYGKGPAVLTAAGDFSKGIIAVFLVRAICGKAGIQIENIDYIAGLFVILGHVKPLFFGFHGGKGVMTTLGLMLALNPLVFLIIVIIFIPLVFATKIVSLCSVIGAVAYPVLTWLMDVVRRRPALSNTLYAAIYMVIILVMHRSNIKRLLAGTENKFGQKK